MNMKHAVGIFIAFILVTGCAFIAGRDEALSPAGGAELKLLFVETLRNEASLRGESFRELERVPSFPNETESAIYAATTLRRPNGVFADAFRVYVTDTYLTDKYIDPGSASNPVLGETSARIFVFDRGKQTAAVFGPPPRVPTPPLIQHDDVKLLAPSSIAVDATGVIFVSDSQQGRVFGYDRNGRLLIEIGRAGDFSSPSGLAVDNVANRLYVADSHARLIKVYTNTGTWLTDMGGSGTTGFNSLSAITLDRGGNLYALDGRGLRVSLYGQDGKFLRDFNVTGDAPGLSVRPKGIAVDSSGRVYITDSVNNNVLIFDQGGKLIQTWGRTGRLSGDFWTPAGIYIDDRDYIYIADQTNGRVQVFQYIR
jgi:DNA-binding beta-propeller fold protein YncE